MTTPNTSYIIYGSQTGSLMTDFSTGTRIWTPIYSPEAGPIIALDSNNSLSISCATLFETGFTNACIMAGVQGRFKLYPDPTTRNIIWRVRIKSADWQTLQTNSGPTIIGSYQRQITARSTSGSWVGLSLFVTRSTTKWYLGFHYNSGSTAALTENFASPISLKTVSPVANLDLRTTVSYNTAASPDSFYLTNVEYNLNGAGWIAEPPTTTFLSGIRAAKQGIQIFLGCGLKNFCRFNATISEFELIEGMMIFR